MSNKAHGRTMFVTVGTTLFEKLVQLVTTVEAINWMERNNYTRLIIQYGKGEKPDIDEEFVLVTNRLDFEFYDFKANLAEDMAKADLVLSHAGAGTVSEVLRLERPRLVVVVNTKLMDNHQLELAHAMRRRGHLYVVEDPEKLLDFSVWDEFEQFKPRPLDPTDKYSFANLLGFFLKIDRGG